MQLLKTYKNKILLAVFILILGVVGHHFGIVEFHPGINTPIGELRYKTPPSATSTQSEQDLRKSLIDNVFDIVSEIINFNTDLQKSNLVDKYKGKRFNSSGTLQNAGKFPNNEVWVTISGNTKDGSSSLLECHFDDSWENTLSDIFDRESKSVKFSGEIGYSIQGWLVATDCEITKIF